MLILTDVDDVLLRGADALQQFFEDEYGLISEHRLKDYHNIPKLYDISIERTLEMIAHFHRSSAFGKMVAEPHAATTLPELHRTGYRFVAITACLNEPETVQARLSNLTEVFGFEWEAVHCLGLTLCKKDALAAYPPAIWVDDLPRHTAAGAEVGHRSFLIDKPYNRQDNHPDVTRVSGWDDLARML